MLVATAVVLGACHKDSNGDVVVTRPGDVDIKTTQDTLKMPEIGTKTDTINAPVVGTKTDTLIVKKPVLGTEPKVVKVPTIKKP
jgi:hypothetical protein